MTEKDTKLEPPKKQEISLELIKRDPSNWYLYKQYRNKVILFFVLYDKIIRGRITQISKYMLQINNQKKWTNKADIIYVFKPDTAVTVRKKRLINHELTNEKLKAPYRKKERAILPEEIIVDACKQKLPVSITLRNGQIFEGIIHSYGIFSVRLQIDDDKRILMMKPSIHSINLTKVGEV